MDAKKKIAHCTSCRKDLDIDGVDRIPLDGTGDTTAESKTGRYSIFCKSCKIFLKVIEPIVQKDVK